MLDDEALILIAHSDSGTLMALYTLLDAEGYFVAPCYSKTDLLKNCKQYKPELVMTSNPLADDDGGRLLETIKEHSPMTQIIVLADVLNLASGGGLLEASRMEEILRMVNSLPVPHLPVHSNGF